MTAPGRRERGWGGWGRGGRPDPGGGGAPASAWGVGIRPERGPEPTRVQPATPRTQDPAAGARAAYAEVAGGAWRRRWVRIRSITCGWVMNPTTRIAWPHRGQRSGAAPDARGCGVPP